MISNNFAFYAPITEIFDSSATSLINNCTITQNVQKSKEEILTEVIQERHILENYKTYIESNTELLDQNVIENAFELIIANLIINGSSIVTDQDYLIYTIYSSLTLNDVYLTTTELSGNMFYIAESEIIADYVVIDNVTTTTSTDLFLIAYSTFDLAGINYIDSQLRLLQISFSSGSISYLSSSQISNTSYLLLFRESTDLYITHSTIQSVNLTENVCQFSNSEITLIENMTLSDLNQPALNFESCQIQTISSLNVDSAPSGIMYESCNVTDQSMCTFSNCGDEEQFQGKLT